MMLGSLGVKDVLVKVGEDRGIGMCSALSLNALSMSIADTWTGVGTARLHSFIHRWI